jgi:ribosome production factor 2
MICCKFTKRHSVSSSWRSRLRPLVSVRKVHLAGRNSASSTRSSIIMIRTMSVACTPSSIVAANLSSYRKPKNARSKRALEDRQSKLVENQKTTLLLRGSTASDLIQTVLTDLNSLKKPHSIKFTKKNTVVPFEDAAPLEFFSEKNDASLLVLGTHSKKRPQNLVIARTFDHKILDIHEFGVDEATYRSLQSFKTEKPKVGVKPMLLFTGDVWERDNRMKGIKNLWLDFFRGETVKSVDVEGLQYVISFMARPQEGETPMVHMRAWMIRTKKSGQKLPRVEVEETGPRMDLRVRRVQEASAEMLKEALKTPRQQLVSLTSRVRGVGGADGVDLQPKTKKNISTDIIGDKIGRIHTGKQDLNKLQSRKMKGLKKRDIGDIEDDATMVDDDKIETISLKKARRE